MPQTLIVAIVDYCALAHQKFYVVKVRYWHSLIPQKYLLISPNHAVGILTAVAEGPRIRARIQAGVQKILLLVQVQTAVVHEVQTAVVQIANEVQIQAGVWAGVQKILQGQTAVVQIALSWEVQTAVVQSLSWVNEHPGIGVWHSSPDADSIPGQPHLLADAVTVVVAIVVVVADPDL